MHDRKAMVEQALWLMNVQAIPDTIDLLDGISDH